MVHEVKNPSTERLSKQLTKAGKWIPSLFLKFCIESYRNGDVDAIDFIEKFTTEEYRLLLKSAASKTNLIW